MQLHKRQLFYVTVLLLGLVWIALSAETDKTAPTRQMAAPQKGFLAPDFSLPQMESESAVTLSDLRGRVIVVNFWASWCPPCKAEMPAMQKIYTAYQSQGLIVLAVNSTVQDSQNSAADFAKQNNLTFPILLDLNGKATRQYAIRSLPTTFFIDRDGVIREIVIGGPMSEALLQTRVEDLLKEHR